MDFNQFLGVLQSAHRQPLPGSDAQHLLAPVGRPHFLPKDAELKNIRKAGVMALFIKTDSKPHLVLIERATSKGVHSGQIAFPGGQVEKQDLSFKETALRETEEEIGLQASEIEVFGSFSPIYIEPSNYLVHPFTGIYHGNPAFVPQVSEVANIISIDFNHFLLDSSIIEQNINVRGFNMKVPTFYIDGHTIWGATAMMLSELRQMIIGVL